MRVELALVSDGAAPVRLRVRQMSLPGPLGRPTLNATRFGTAGRWRRPQKPAMRLWIGHVTEATQCQWTLSCTVL